MSQLKPCPFCGGEAKNREPRAVSGAHDWFVQCKKQDCLGHFVPDGEFLDLTTRDSQTKEEAIEKWNNRPMLDEAVVLIERIYEMGESGEDFEILVKDMCSDFLTNLDVEVEE